MEAVERYPKISFSRPIGFQNAIQLGRIPWFVARRGMQRVVNFRHPVRTEAIYDRTAVSVTPKVWLEELLDCTVTVGLELDSELRGDALNFTAPILEKVGILDEHAR
jgi:hypothetical protein